jgi:hypothetical protein
VTKASPTAASQPFLFSLLIAFLFVSFTDHHKTISSLLLPKNLLSSPLFSGLGYHRRVDAPGVEGHEREGGTRGRECGGRRVVHVASDVARPGPCSRRSCCYRRGRAAMGLVFNICGLSLIFFCESRSDETCVFLLVYVLCIDSNL